MMMHGLAKPREKKKQNCCHAVHSTKLKYDRIIITFHTFLLFRYKTAIFTDKEEVTFIIQVFLSFKNVVQ